MPSGQCRKRLGYLVVAATLTRPRSCTYGLAVGIWIEAENHEATRISFPGTLLAKGSVGK